MDPLTSEPPIDRRADAAVSHGDGVVRVGRIIGAGPRSIFADLTGAIRACALPTLLIVIAQGLLIEVARRSTYGGSERWGFFEAVYVVVSLVIDNLYRTDWSVIVLLIVTACCYVMLARVGLLRILPDRTRLAEELRTPGGRFLRMALVTVVCCVIALVGLVGAVYLGFVIAVETDVAAGILAFFLVLIATIALVMDIALVLPMIVVTGTMGWMTLRRLASGKTGKTGKLALALTLAFVLSLVHLVLAGLPAALVGHLLEAVSGPTPGLATQASMALYGIAGAIGCVMLMGSLAEAYPQLGGPGLGVPESVLTVFDDA